MRALSGAAKRDFTRRPDHRRQRNDADDLTAVAISPDLGERYLETIYADEWVEENYGSALTDTFPAAWLRSTATAAGA